MKGHKYVRAQISEKLNAQLPIRLGNRKPRFIGPGDDLPTADEKWPCVLVMTTKAIRSRNLKVFRGERKMTFNYACEVIIAVRGPQRDPLAVADWRDDMLLAVRETLVTSPVFDAGDGYVLMSRLDEETGPISRDGKERLAAMGSIKFEVQTVEIATAIDGQAVEDVDGVDLVTSGYSSDQSLPA